MDAVTGAHSYSGAAIAAELASRGRRVRTLTNHPRPHRRPSGGATDPIEVFPLALDDPQSLRDSLEGVDTLYNTFWVRFPHKNVTFETGVRGSEALFEAAAEAGVRRIVHVSILHADPASPYPYFSGKGRVEAALKQSGVSWAIVRPSVLFGGDGVLINNMAWMLRHSPVTLYGGDGRYRVRPIHIADLARLMCSLGASDEQVTVDAVGPDDVPFRALLDHLRRSVGSHSVIAAVPGAVFPVVTWLLGAALRDTVLTRDEYLAMSQGLATSTAPSTGTISLLDWISVHGDDLGRRYAHELKRHYLPNDDDKTP